MVEAIFVMVYLLIIFAFFALFAGIIMVQWWSVEQWTGDIFLALAWALVVFFFLTFLAWYFAKERRDPLGNKAKKDKENKPQVNKVVWWGLMAGVVGLLGAMWVVIPELEDWTWPGRILTVVFIYCYWTAFSRAYYWARYLGLVFRKRFRKRR